MYSSSGDVAGVVQVECPACAAAWEKSPNWRSPYSKDATLPASLRRSAPASAPSPTPSPAAVQGSAPAPTPGPEAPTGTSAQAAAPAPASAAVALVVPPVALVPAIPASTGDSQQGQGQGVVAQQGPGDEPAAPADDAQHGQPGAEADVPAEGQQQQQEEGSGSDNTVMIAVVASVCGVVALALLGLLCCFCKRRCCFRPRIQPQPAWCAAAALPFPALLGSAARGVQSRPPKTTPTPTPVRSQAPALVPTFPAVPCPPICRPEDQMTVKNPAFEDDEKEARSIQVKVQRPKEANQALHENDVPAGRVLIPGWEPAQPRPY